MIDQSDQQNWMKVKIDLRLQVGDAAAPEVKGPHQESLFNLLELCSHWLDSEAPACFLPGEGTWWTGRCTLRTAWLSIMRGSAGSVRPCCSTLESI